MMKNNTFIPTIFQKLLVNDTGKLNVHFDYTNWHDSEFGPTARIEYFEYKYLNKNRELVDLDLIERMKKFEEKYP